MTWNTVTPSDDGWRLIIDHWRRTGEWNSSNGPRPGEPGCRVPSHLLIADANSVAPDFPPGTATVETIAPKLNGAEVASDVAFPWDYTQTGKLKVKSYANTYNGLHYSSLDIHGSTTRSMIGNWPTVSSCPTVWRGSCANRFYEGLV